jgi:ribonuclease Z
VISGDTRYSGNLVRHAAGADVLLHEVIAAPEAIRDQPSVRFRLSHHTPAADAARVFQQARPRLAVFTHLALVGTRDHPAPTVDDVLADASRVYAGRMVVGEDLMRIVVGETIEVQRPAARRDGE